MKKIIALLLVLMSVLTAGFSVMAAGGEIIADVTYNVPPVFVKSVQTEDAAGYDGVENGIINSRIIVTYSKDMVADGVTVETMDTSFFDRWYDEEYLLTGMVYQTADVRITERYTNLITTKAGIPAYVYELKYTILAEEYGNFYGYFKSVIFINGNDLYCFEYTYDRGKATTQNAFSEVIDSVEFKKEIKIDIDGEIVVPDSAPVIIEGRTLCPIRAVAEKLGYMVDWNGETKTAIIKNDELILEIQIGAMEMIKTAIVDNARVKPEIIPLDVPAEIINDRTYLPLRAIGEALGCEVDWDGATRTVIIKSK